MSAAPEALSAALADRYRVERELGAGGMATVYLAQDLKHARKVALKVLRPELSASLGPERFVREITIAAGLTHPHILPLFDSGEAAGFLYYVMPFVEGMSLREKLAREGELPVADAVRILRDMADAMAYAHDRGVVHRDIKPENVMLSGRHALVTDFGVAKAVTDATAHRAEHGTEPGTTLTMAGVVLGTPAYMAPEQATADPHLDHRADLYAWGVVAYELLAGRPPFDRATSQEILAAHVTEAAEPVNKHRGSISPALANLVMRALEKRPADRWQRADELVTHLETLSTSSGGMTPSTTRAFTTAAAPAPPRRRRAIIGAGALGLVLAAGPVWWATRDRSNVDPNLVVVAPFENRTGDRRYDALGDVVADRLTNLIAREGVTQPVPSATVREVLRANASRTGPVPALLSARTRAGLIVVGTVSQRGDSLEYHAEVLRQPAGTPIGQVEPIVSANEARGIEELGQGLATLLAANRDWGDEMKWGRDFSLPARLDAYRAFVDALEASGDKALAGIDTAIARAPGWRLAAVWRSRVDGSDHGDSVLAQLLSQPGLLPGDRAVAMRHLARRQGDWDRVHALARELYRLAPKTFAEEACGAALRAARHEEAAGYARHLQDTTFWTASTRRGPGLRTCICQALHALGRYPEELKHALALRRESPEDPAFYLTAEIMARAALHQPDEVERAVSEGEGLETQGILANLSRAWVAGVELRAHGDSAGALRAFERATAWHLQRLDGGDSTFERVEALVESLAYGLRWDEVRVRLPLLAGLASSPAESAWAIWYRALLEARTGNRPAALEAIKRFEGLDLRDSKPPYQSRPHLLARIYSAMGDTTEAIAKFREAFALGEQNLRSHWLWHRELDAYMIALPAFKQLVRTPQ